MWAPSFGWHRLEFNLQPFDVEPEREAIKWMGEMHSSFRLNNGRRGSRDKRQFLPMSLSIPPPVAIGGVGGSGTRMVARLLSSLGFYLGDDLNLAGDNLWFAFFFRRARLLSHQATKLEIEMALEIFRASMLRTGALNDTQRKWMLTLYERADTPRNFGEIVDAGGGGHSDRIPRIVRTAIAAAESSVPPPLRWGWKEPNTHIFIDHLEQMFPRMKYIHVIRNGLDMALSSNQNQVALWGQYFLPTATLDGSPRCSLKYWCAVHRRIMRIGQNMGKRFLLLNFDTFCANPSENVAELASFLGINIDDKRVHALSELIVPPPSIGRFRSRRRSEFDECDIDYVQSFGFETVFSE